MQRADGEALPIEVLRSEHRVILRVLCVLERLVARSESGGSLELAPLGQCVEFFRLFADACHHAKEEDLLFPALESRGIPREGGPIGVMLEEHRMARGFTREMGEALKACANGEDGAEFRFRTAAHSYVELLTHHIQKEDNVLFVMGDRMLTEEDQNGLCSKFCEVGCRAFEGRRRDELMSIAEELEQAWPAE